jgi:hypothetical protein
MHEEKLAGLLEEPIDWRYRGRPADRDRLTVATLGERRWNLLAGDSSYPCSSRARSSTTSRAASRTRASPSTGGR